MTPVRYLDRLHSASSDRVVLQALGLLLAGAFILLWAGLRLAPKQIGA